MNFQTPMPKKRTLNEVKKDDSEPMREEEYLDQMEKIIKRDFFPELSKIDEMKKPIQTDHEEQEALDLTLNEFINQVKSEDHEIFKEIIKKEDESWRKRMWWLFMAEKNENQALKAIENDIQYDTIKKIENKEKVGNRLQICPYEPKNHMFFYQKSIKDSENQDKGKKIIYENTRFEGHDKLLEISHKHQKKDIMSNLNNFSTPALIGLKKQFEKEGKKYNLDSIRSAYSEFNEVKSKVNGYSLLDMPSPNPSKLGSPIMTYGEVEDTPLRLERQKQEQSIEDKINSNKFILQRRDHREEVAKGLANQITVKKQKQNKEQKQEQISKLMQSVTPSSVMGSVRSQGGHSKQGQQLIKEIMKIRQTARSSAFDTPQSGSRSVRSGVSRISAYKKIQ